MLPLSCTVALYFDGSYSAMTPHCKRESTSLANLTQTIYNIVNVLYNFCIDE